MTVDIISAEIADGIVSFEAVDSSEENLMRMERIRDDGFERTVRFVFDTSEPKTFKYLYHWLHSQKIIKERNPKTYGEAVQAVVGTRVNINGHYREWD